MNKKIIFILGSGRCGTYSFFKALEKFKNIEAHHEFFFEPTLKIATLYQMKKITKNKVKSFLEKNHYFSIKNSKKKIWIVSCNALPWISDVLIDMFPEAKFIHLVRNGKKVVSSFYNKFNNEMYRSENVKKLYNHIKNQKKNLLSSEKKYWRPLPIHNKNDFNQFISKGQFYRICKYWEQINYKIETSLKKTQNKLFFKLEDLENGKKLQEIAKFVCIKKKDYKKFVNSFKKPTNVSIPKNIILTKQQNKIFYDVCQKAMLKYKYNDREYEVKY
tara:strand:- start:757 stop:1578 length:822 start_codon:yes stop_codon:yes gene_type:complete